MVRIREIADVQPTLVCQPCGAAYGDGHSRTATTHEAICSVCGEVRAVTDPRRYGWLSLGWVRHRDD